jgi:hypothetical protein
MLVQPKPYIDAFKLRHKAFGTERRRNMSKMILEKGTPFPKPIEYSDIDNSMFKWVEEHIKLSYDGKRLPIYKLYSTQRLSEYLQEWDKQDEAGNPIINFLTITRENNPQKGESQGNYFNIPGHKDFAMWYVPVLQENGTEAFDKYTMKQPFQVNFIYSVSIVANKMEIINEMNELMHYEFSAIDCYISPNDHPMSMTLEDVSDNSEYAIDDRKYYSQTYKIKVRGYIIRKEDYKVERIPSRFLIPWKDSDASGIIHRRGKNRREEDKVTFMTFNLNEEQKIKTSSLFDDYHNCPVPEMIPTDKPSEIYEPTNDAQDCCIPPPPRCYNKLMKIIMNFDCVLELAFEIDKDMILESVETKNVFDFKLLINDELVNFENDVKFLNGDNIKVRISRDEMEKSSEITLIGYDPNTVIDTQQTYETTLDEPIDEEHILVNPSEEIENE